MSPFAWVVASVLIVLGSLSSVFPYLKKTLRIKARQKNKEVEDKEIEIIDPLRAIRSQLGMRQMRR